MAFTIVGLTAMQRVLTRQNFRTDANGLDTIIMNLVIRTEDKNYVVPKIGTNHVAFTQGFYYPYPSFSRMEVVSVNTEEQDGGLTEMIVTFEGLMFSSGIMPPPILRFIPTEGQGVYGPPLVIQAEYITFQTETQFLALFDPQNNLTEPILGFTKRIKMPKFINGYEMPKDPKEAFFRPPGTGGGVVEEYLGYCYISVACERRGGVLVVTSTFAELQNIAIVIGCWVAREVYGEDNPDWLLFRKWLFSRAPVWLLNKYIEYGERIAKFISNKKRIKALLRMWMDSKINKSKR